MTEPNPSTNGEADQANGTLRHLLRDSWRYLFLAGVTGLFLGIAIQLPPLAGPILLIAWLPLALFLWYIFKLQRLHWVEWVVLAAVTLVATSLPLSLSESRSMIHYVEVPVPANSFTAGTQGLIAGRPVELVALIPNKDKTPEAKYFTNVVITSFLGGAEDSAEPGSILVAVPAAQAEDLQLALAAEGSKLTYRLLDGTPTPTQSISSTSTPTPILTPTPKTGMVYVELDTNKINPLAASLITGAAELIIVEKAPASGDTAEALIPSYIATQDTICSDVVAFIDENGAWQSRYSADTQKVRLQIDQADIAKYARRMAAAETIWLINVEKCPLP